MAAQNQILKCFACGWQIKTKDVVVCPQCGQNMILRTPDGQRVSVKPPSRGVVIGQESQNTPSTVEA